MSMMTAEEYFASFGDVEIVAISKFQQVVARRLTASWTSIPHVTHNDEVDITNLMSYRKGLPPEVKISPLIFLMKALALALRQFPDFNGSLSEDGKHLIRKRYIHVGIAVDGPHGLVVPVIRNVDEKYVQALAEELAELSARARGKGLQMTEMAGGCMTITSLGGIGGTSFTPIVNPPELAILGVTQARTIAAWNGDSFVPRQVITLSLSYDHRVINGADAARFVRYIGDAIGQPERL